jgi:hypothetical protein
VKPYNGRTRKGKRPALIRRALQEYPKRLHVSDLKEQDRRGYEAQPQEKGEVQVWEDAAAWPEH